MLDVAVRVEEADNDIVLEGELLVEVLDVGMLLVLVDDVLVE